MPYVVVLALTLCSVRGRGGRPLGAARIEAVSAGLFNFFTWRPK